MQLSTSALAGNRNEYPLVSVILPTYNRRHLVTKSIRSVLGQTYRNFELIVVDDGSTDGTQALVRSIAPSVRYLWQEHQGVAAARNRGLAEARGELIAFQDSDDLWHPEKLAIQVDLLHDQPFVGVVCTAKRVIDENGNVVGGQWKELYSGRVTEALFQSIFVTMPSAIVRRGVVEQLGQFDTSLRISSDYQFWLRASLITEFAAIHRPLVDARRSPNGLTSAKAEGMVLQYHMLARFFSELEGRDSIRPALARQVLAKSAFRAGRALEKEGGLVLAKQMYGESLNYYTSVRVAWARLRAQYASAIHRSSNRRLPASFDGIGLPLQPLSTHPQSVPISTVGT